MDRDSHTSDLDSTSRLTYLPPAPMPSEDEGVSVTRNVMIAEPSQRRQPSTDGSAGGETWTGFLTRAEQDAGGEPSQSGLTGRRATQQPHPIGVGMKRQPTMSDDQGNKRINTEYRSPSPSHEAHGRTASHPIDLTSPERPPRTSSRLPIHRHRSNDSIVLPTWQHDNEVDRCPVCGTGFSFWYRKHHCRKCGRVVCANCSPHRITIPRQFIVQPPAAVSPFASFAGVLEVTDNGAASAGQSGLTSPSGNALPRVSGPTLSGGETVRVCNPCVPDPNFSPPPQRPPLPSSVVSMPSVQRETARPPPGLFITGSRRVTQDGHAASHSSVMQARPSGPYADGRRATIAPTTGVSSHPLNSQRAVPPFAQSLGQATLGFASRSFNPRFADRTARPSSSAPRAPRPPQPVPPPQVQVRQIPEEDECPVCGHELPPKGLDGDEDARIKHVDTCVQRYSAPSMANSSSSAGPPSAASTGTNSSSAVVHAPAAPLPVRANVGASSAPSLPRGVGGNRMLVYRASEKDYIGEDGEPQECVICFEEFEPGDELGRLECLCKFHRVCIRQWWETKGVGSCPTHQLHD